MSNRHQHKCLRRQPRIFRCYDQLHRNSPNSTQALNSLFRRQNWNMQSRRQTFSCRSGIHFDEIDNFAGRLSKPFRFLMFTNYCHRELSSRLYASLGLKVKLLLCLWTRKDRIVRYWTNSIKLLLLFQMPLARNRAANHGRCHAFLHFFDEPIPIPDTIPFASTGHGDFRRMPAKACRPLPSRPKGLLPRHCGGLAHTWSRP